MNTLRTLQGTPDQELLALSHAGNKTAAGVLLIRYEAKVLLVICRWTKNLALAQDILQKTYIRAWINLHKFLSRNFVSWLLVIARNCFLHHCVRKKNYAKHAPVDSLENALAYPAPDDDAIDGPRNARRLQKYFATLPQRSQVLLHLHFIEGKSYREIGEALNFSVEYIKRHIYQLRNTLQRSLMKNESILLKEYGIKGKRKIRDQSSRKNATIYFCRTSLINATSSSIGRPSIFACDALLPGLSPTTT